MTAVSECEMYDLVVVGGGPIGLSTAYNCAKVDQKVLLLERFVLYNQSGSSAGLLRMFRTMYTEDYMADLAKDSIQLWNELESDAGVKLREMSGLLNFGDPTYQNGPEGNLKGPIKNLKRLHMKYQELTAEEIMQQLPFKDLPSHFEGLWAPDNGCINVDLVVRKLAELSRKNGVTIMEYANVQKINVVDGNDVRVEMKVCNPQSPADGDGAYTLKTFRARRCAITTGAYTNHILQPSFGIKLNLDIWEMVYAFYSCDPELVYPRTPSADPDTIQALEGHPFKCMWFQFAKNDSADPHTSNLFYGFPSVPWGPPNLARIAVDNAARRITDPDDRQTNPSAYDIERTRTFIREHIRWVSTISHHLQVLVSKRIFLTTCSCWTIFPNTVMSLCSLADGALNLCRSLDASSSRCCLFAGVPSTIYPTSKLHAMELLPLRNRHLIVK